MHPYAPRVTRSLGLRTHRDWTVKCYSIEIGPEPFDERRFEAGAQLALASLPEPATARGRIGVAVLILHQGRGVDYAVLGWWDRENELPLRVFVCESPGSQWRPARGSESICVWDMEVLWAEREMYVTSVLNPDAGSATDYLAGVATRE